MKLRTLWKISDLVAAVISALYMIIVVPMLLVLILCVLIQVPMETKIANIPGDIMSLLAVLGGVLGIASLIITALVPIQKICSKKLRRNLIIFGLISGIAAALYYHLAESSFFFWPLCYMVVSATMHIIELFTRKKETVPYPEFTESSKPS